MFLKYFRRLKKKKKINFEVLKTNKINMVIGYDESKESKINKKKIKISK